ncbi:hypothetical protein E2562_035518 [Oryza meyeriana var. granulata]|uniref:Uncharacterized protein n=1 Tax=Oryza meyeriana var. granulata TaxID=110450 RepID=A0A6G1DA95_9ORYZ|nr:hypothetical protein E2562_035518 [Oryza meyeriana var. granulata]
MSIPPLPAGEGDAASAGLAFLHDVFTHFVPTTSSFLPHDGFLYALDFRHGRSLFLNLERSSRARRLLVDLGPRAVLCAAAGCDHTDCRGGGGGSFLLVAVTTKITHNGVKRARPLERPGHRRHLRPEAAARASSSAALSSKIVGHVLAGGKVRWLTDRGDSSRDVRQGGGFRGRRRRRRHPRTVAGVRWEACMHEQGKEVSDGWETRTYVSLIASIRDEAHVPGTLGSMRSSTRSPASVIEDARARSGKTSEDESLWAGPSERGRAGGLIGEVAG